jgi:seryl-tRNA synthetase
VTFNALGLKKAAEFTEAARERLRINAVTSFMLFRVLRDGWSLDRFVEDMASVVWNAPSRTRPEDAAAVLAAARSTEALSQLSRHSERMLSERGRQTGEARTEAARESRRADTAEEEIRRLAQQLESETRKARDLSDQVADLTHSLEAERSNRVVDKSHLVDDYEVLRTQVIRRLSGQVELLRDGLHALRNRRTDVAEEFLDRSLTAIEGELTRLKDLDGGPQ